MHDFWSWGLLFLWGDGYVRFLVCVEQVSYGALEAIGGDHIEAESGMSRGDSFWRLHR